MHLILLGQTYINTLADVSKLGTGFLLAVVTFFGLQTVRAPKAEHRNQFFMLLAVLAFEVLSTILFTFGYLYRMPTWAHPQFWPFWLLPLMLLPASRLLDNPGAETRGTRIFQRIMILVPLLALACFALPVLPGILLIVCFVVLGIMTLLRYRKEEEASLLPATASLGFMLLALGSLLGLVAFAIPGFENPDLYIIGFSLVQAAILFVAVLMMALQEKKHHRTELAMDQARKELLYRINHDGLTGLLNRSALVACLEDEYSRSVDERLFSLALHVDIDHFHEINDGLGSQKADQLLVQGTGILKEIVGDPDLLFRIGEDKFVILLPEGAGRDLAARMAQTILSEFNSSRLTRQFDTYLTVSIGIAPLYREDSQSGTCEELMRNLDLALDVAKLERNTYRFFIPGMVERGANRIQVTNYLRHAIDREELSLHFQPQVDVNGCVSGAEALLRWNNPVLGNVPPDEFISIAEESGLIIPVGEWVIKHACMELAHWRDLGIDIPLSINMSTRQLKDPHIEWTLLDCLKSHGLSPESLHLEITESLVLEENHETLRILEGLSERGFHISIDDFGTGYANLSYLKRLPVSALKIDRSFITEIPGNTQDLAVLQAICEMARNLGLSTIAEGVDREDQMDALREMECTAIQGFLYSRPVPSEEFITYCRSCA